VREEELEQEGKEETGPGSVMSILQVESSQRSHSCHEHFEKPLSLQSTSEGPHLAPFDQEEKSSQSKDTTGHQGILDS
jgi:hypothetical protein